MSCWICGHPGPLRKYEALDADGRGVPFRYALCERCCSGAMIEPPVGECLGAWYGSSYYGAGRTKFHRPLQWVFERSAGQLAGSIASRVAKDGRRRVLDVGCGRGMLLEMLRARGFDCTGVERAAHADAARQDGLEILSGDLADLQLPSRSFDAVVFWHVLEHLDDPERTLREATRLLEPGGLLVLAVPNQASWQARVFGRHWFHLDLPRHLHFFGHAGLGQWLGENGYSLRGGTTLHLVQNVYGFIQSSLNALFPTRPNRQYRLMRSLSGMRDTVELCAWLALSSLLAPAALLELWLSAARGRGASSILYAIRDADPPDAA